MVQSLGYKPKLSSPASVDLDIFQTVPAISSGTGDSYSTKPDLNYAMNLKAGMQVQSDTGISFVTTEDCNFKFSSSYDPMTITVYESSANVPVTYLLKKGVRASSGVVAYRVFYF